jgi:hypothetical protein
MANPDYTYVKARVDGEKWILAKDRLDAVAAIANPLGLKVAIEEEFSGRKLEGVRYEYPLLEEVPVQGSAEFKKFHYVTLSDQFVTLEEGTGLVHTAPGHGPQDFEIGKREKMPPFCPVDSRGVYMKEAGKYKGEKVLEVGGKILDDLKAKGLLGADPVQVRGAYMGVAGFLVFVSFLLLNAGVEIMTMLSVLVSAGIIGIRTPSSGCRSASVRNADVSATSRRRAGDCRNRRGRHTGNPGKFMKTV